MIFVGAQCSNELQRLDLKIGNQDGSPSKMRQGEIPCCGKLDRGQATNNILMG